jgi:diacylglycerol kinase (ATP)
MPTEAVPDINHVQVIVNPAAGLDDPILKTLNTAIHEHGASWDVSITNARGDGTRLAQEAIANGADVVAACGGDGTLMEVAAGMVGSDVPLAFLPAGTGNVMASELRIPRRLDKAASLLFDPASVIRPVDLGQVNDRYFIMRASIGFEAAVVEKTTREMKDRFGLLAYGVAILQALSEPLKARYHLTLDGEAVEVEGFSLLIANAGSIGRLNLVLNSTITLDDGLLDVMILNDHPESVLSIAASVIQLDEFTAALQHWQAKEVTITCDRPQTVQGDGELLGQTPVTARVVPQAVRVITPGGE